MATATKQKKLTVRVTLATFDQSSGRPTYRVLRESVKLADFKPIGVEEYRPTGNTPLIDAAYEYVTHVTGMSKDTEVHVGLLLDESYSMLPNMEAVITSVNDYVNKIKEVKDIDPANAGGGFLVIATDGEENSSTRHTYEQLGDLIRKAEADGWVLVFFGAGIDAWHQGRALGLSGGFSGQTVSSVNSAAGTRSAFAHGHAHTMSYLSDNQAYRAMASAQGTVRSIDEDGNVVGADTPTGEFDSATAIRSTTDKLSK